MHILIELNNEGIQFIFFFKFEEHFMLCYYYFFFNLVGHIYVDFVLSPSLHRNNAGSTIAFCRQWLKKKNTKYTSATIMTTLINTVITVITEFHFYSQIVTYHVQNT